MWFIATVIGASAAFWFSIAGLGWSNGFMKRRLWEEGESDLGVGIGIVAVLVWLLLLGLSTFLLRGGSPRLSRDDRATSVVLPAVSVGVVVTLCVLAIAWPESPSEYPLPPWNRA